MGAAGAAGVSRRPMRLRALLLALSPALCASAASTRRLKATVLSWTPRIVAYENFLSDEEVDVLRKEAENQTFLRTALIGKNGFFVKGSTITSRIANMPQSHSGYVVRRRIADTTQLPVEFQEPTRVLRYNSSDFFRGHIDAHALSGRFSSTRTATFFVYLNDVADGGETHFPLAVPVANVSAGRGFVREGPAGPHCAHLVSKESSQGGMEAEYIDGYDLLEGRGAKLSPPISRRGLSIVPRKGLAILWHSRRPDGQLDPSSQHVGCPVKEIDRRDPERRFKYSLTTWIHFEPPKYELMEDAPLDTHGAFLSLGRPRGGARGTARLRPSQDRFDSALLGGWLGGSGRRELAMVQRRRPRGSGSSAPTDGNTTATARQRLDSALARLEAEERNVSFSRARLERRGAELDGAPAASGPGGGARQGSSGRGAAHAPGREGLSRTAGTTPLAAESPAEVFKKAAALRGAARAAVPQRAAEPAGQQRAAHPAGQHEEPRAAGQTPELARELDTGEELRAVMERDEEELERELGRVGAVLGPGSARQVKAEVKTEVKSEVKVEVNQEVKQEIKQEVKQEPRHDVKQEPEESDGQSQAGLSEHGVAEAGASGHVEEEVELVKAQGAAGASGAAGRPAPGAASLRKARSIVGELARSTAGPNGTGTTRRPGPGGAAPGEAKSIVGELARSTADPNGTGTTRRPGPGGAAPDEARSIVGELARSTAGPNGTGTTRRPGPGGAAPGEAAAHDAERAAPRNRTGEARVAHRAKPRKHHRHHQAKKVEHHKGHHKVGLHSSGTADHPKAPACVDVAPLGEEKWHDADGSQFDCFFYAQGDGCKLYGRRFPKFNLTAADACCACGGGRWAGAAVQESELAKLRAENARLLKELGRLKSQVGLLDEDVHPPADPDVPDDWSGSDLVDWMPCPAWQNSTCAVHWETSPDSLIGLADGGAGGLPALGADSDGLADSALAASLAASLG